MMPGVGFAEMMLLALVAVVVIGPKDLPLMMRKFGRFTGKMRAMAFEFKQGFDELGRQAELEELRKEVADLKKHTGLEDLERDLNEDARGLEADLQKTLAAPSQPAIASNGAANGTADPPVTYPGLSADDPGYDAGGDHRIDGYQQEPPPAPKPDAPPEAAGPPAMGSPEPVKQDTPA